MSRLIIDCDPGNGVPGANVDDAIALSYAAKCPELDLVSIWTVFGNTCSDQGWSSARRLLESLQESTIMVRRGADEPSCGGREHWIRNRRQAANDPQAPGQWRRNDPTRPKDASTGSTPATALAPAPPISSAHDLAQDLLATDKPTTVAAIGPLTNLSAVISKEPEAARRIGRIYVMGGALGFGDLVDTNFAVDPQAARTVLESGIPLTLVPLDVTRTTHLSQERWELLLGRADRTEAPWASDIDAWLAPWLHYSRRTRPVDGMWLHDLVAVAAASQPSLVRSETAEIAIAPNGKLHRADDSTLPAGSSQAVSVDLVTAVDNEALIDSWARVVLRE
ncbi:nucleoside hydrolase [Bifidobacterium xylocopae]|nr:nucleoside hydrolase [Bifidobacterium xylocopae]